MVLGDRCGSDERPAGPTLQLRFEVGQARAGRKVYLL